MTYKSEFYPESKFGGFSNIDGTIAFYSHVNALLSSDSVVVDFGCGRGSYQADPLKWRRELRILRGKAARIIGLDVDPAAQDNPCIDEFHQLSTEAWPVETGLADLIICDNVIEHLKEPGEFFREAQRVLKPGATLCIRTPNAWNYVALLSRLIPNRFHARVTSMVQEGRQEDTVFSTFYRCNSLFRLRRMLRAHGFVNHVVLGYEAEPSYLSFSKFAYWLGTLHQKAAPGFFRAVILAFAQKQGVAPNPAAGKNADA